MGMRAYGERVYGTRFHSIEEVTLMSSVMPDPATPFGERVARRLREERAIWLTTVGTDGTPQPNPVWFLWDGDTILIYSLSTAARLAHIARNPRVSLNLDSDGGDDVVIITGEARIVQGEPLAMQNPAYVAKYDAAIREITSDPEKFAQDYSVVVRITPKKVRGF
jgi:PPOX class probable F420-dependent enzyme